MGGQAEGRSSRASAPGIAAAAPLPPLPRPQRQGTTSRLTTAAATALLRLSTCSWQGGAVERVSTPAGEKYTAAGAHRARASCEDGCCLMLKRAAREQPASR